LASPSATQLNGIAACLLDVDDQVRWHRLEQRDPKGRYQTRGGSFCSQHWAYGRTKTGLLMQCKPSSTDTRFRRRAA